MAARIIARNKRRRAQPHFLIGVALICFTALAMMCFRQRESAASPLPAASPIVGAFDSIRLPVPAAYVPVGKRVRDIQFRTVSFPTQQVPPGALSSLDSILDSVTVAPLPASLPLFRENFVQGTGGSNPVIERIPPGMRAMTIRVDATSSVEGWAGSGSVVDVVLVEKDRTNVVAEKVRVLSAERSVNPVEGSAAPSVPNTITLLVTQEQCLAINTAIPRGKIAFALRSTKDDDSWQDTSFTAEKLNGLAAATEKHAQVTGYATVKDKTQGRSFALSDGKWIQTETVPQGFLVGSENPEKGQ